MIILIRLIWFLLCSIFISLSRIIEFIILLFLDRNKINDLKFRPFISVYETNIFDDFVHVGYYLTLKDAIVGNITNLKDYDSKRSQTNK